jgi:hypothetical protein
MMDNSQGSVSDNKVNSEESKSAQEQVFEVKEAPAKQESKEEVVKKPEVKNEVKQVPIHELYKERNKRKALEEEVYNLRAEQQEIKNSLYKMKSSQDEDELVIEAEKELGLDRESARKLLNLQKKVVDRSKSKETSQQFTDPSLIAMDDFKRRAYEASQNYEDWNDMIPAMQAIMAREIEQNGLSAYKRSPDYYYSKALKGQMQSKETVQKENLLDRQNNISASVTETGSGEIKSTGSKITQAIFDANRKNPQWIQENSDEIRALANRGLLH